MEQTVARPSDRWIPWSIVAFFVFFVVLLSGFAWIAFHTYTGEVTQDAYKKGLAYNGAIDSADAQQKLGWKSDLQAVGHGNALDIAFTLQDASGHAIDGAKIVARCIRPTQAGHDVQLVLHNDKGVYRGSVQLDWRGVWDIHVSAMQGGHNYQQSKTIVLQ